MENKLEKQREDNRELIEALRPHFVFNIMNVLRYIIKKDAVKASDMVYDLSLYMRCKIGSIEDASETTYEEELVYVLAYIRLEQVAMPNLKFVTDVTDGTYEIERGALLEAVEKLVKEQVRVTKEPRTIHIIDCDVNGQQVIKLTVKENDVCIQL